MEMVVAYLKVLRQHLPAETIENHEEPVRKANLLAEIQNWTT
jgi:hypothetical protein